jgi:hypothetical protein
MNRAAKRIAERLKSLELKILVPLELTETQLEAFALPQRDPKNPLFRNAFYCPLADFKQAAYDEVYEWVKNKERIYHWFPKEFYDGISQ